MSPAIPDVHPYESASCGAEKALPSACATCGSPVHLRTLYCEGVTDRQYDLTDAMAYGSTPFRLTREGKPLCLHCAWQDSAPVPTARCVLDEEDWTTREPAAAQGPAAEDEYADFLQVWWELTHPYLLPGSHGGSSGGGRFKRKKTGTRIKREDWTGWI